MKKKILYVAAGLVLFIALALILFHKSSKADVASAPVDYGEFVVKLIEGGEISAIHSASVFAPRVRGRLQINKLVKDGSKVQKGDVVVQFDMVDTQQEMLKSLSDLNISQNEIDKKLSDIESQKRIDQMDLDNTKLLYDESKLELRKGFMLSEVEQEKLKLRYEQAERKYQETLKKMESQSKSNQADLKVLNEKKAKAEADYTMAKKSLQDMTLLAPKEGLVVLKEIWKGTGMSKVQEGDQVWPGYPILEIPDLSAMEIKMYLNEVDVSKVAAGLEASITIDAFPDKTFRGKVERVASMATKKDWDATIKTFETVVSLNEMDSRMRPGMTCMVEVIIKKIPDVVSVPIESVFEKEGKTVVYVMGSRTPKKREVILGDRASTHIVVTQGLSRGDKIALRDPFAGPEAEQAPPPKKS